MRGRGGGKRLRQEIGSGTNAVGEGKVGLTVREEGTGVEKRWFKKKKIMKKKGKRRQLHRRKEARGVRKGRWGLTSRIVPKKKKAKTVQTSKT